MVYHRCIYCEVCICNEVRYVSSPHGGCGLHWRGRRHLSGKGISRVIGVRTMLTVHVGISGYVSASRDKTLARMRFC